MKELILVVVLTVIVGGTSLLVRHALRHKDWQPSEDDQPFSF